VIPLHPRTAVQVKQHQLDHLLDGLRVVEPLAPSTFLALAQEARLIVSDSGGLQEEVTVLKRPLLVPRRSTERPESEGVFSERVSDGDQLVEFGNRWINDDVRRAALMRVPSPYGDGTASERIVSAIVNGYGS
jgi:UDP-N-acetylglucosamine 2-epimerase (non-hydrolysing)